MGVSAAPGAEIAAKGYARPDALVTTQWVADHLNDPSVRLLESNEDILLYDTGHIAGAARSSRRS
jgi:thiosulfate/3-mercaptopyruvate sulfurtransferase